MCGVSDPFARAFVRGGSQKAGTVAGILLYEIRIRFPISSRYAEHSRGMEFSPI